MIKKFFYLFLISCFLVTLETSVSFFAETRWLPDLCLLTIIFSTLSLGFRYGFAVALVAGILKECLTGQIFGMVLVPYLSCAFLADYLKRHLALHESLIARVGVVFACLIAQLMIQGIFFAGHHPMDLSVIGISIVVPQVLVTILSSEVFFNIFRPCASRLFV